MLLRLQRPDKRDRPVTGPHRGEINGIVRQWRKSGRWPEQIFTKGFQNVIGPRSIRGVGIDKMLKRSFAIVAMALLSIPTSAHTTKAVTTAAAPELAVGAKPDVNRRICRTEEMTGSRLNQRRRCMTASEWTEIARLDRESIERTQANRYKGNEGGSRLMDPLGRSN